MTNSSETLSSAEWQLALYFEPTVAKHMLQWLCLHFRGLASILGSIAVLWSLSLKNNKTISLWTMALLKACNKYEFSLHALVLQGYTAVVIAFDRWEIAIACQSQAQRHGMLSSYDEYSSLESPQHIRLL
jgi:hypothetical protein